MFFVPHKKWNNGTKTNNDGTIKTHSEIAAPGSFYLFKPEMDFLISQPEADTLSGKYIIGANTVELLVNDISHVGWNVFEIRRENKNKMLLFWSKPVGGDIHEVQIYLYR